MNIYAAVVASIFGGGTRHPLAFGVLRIASLGGGGIALGLLLAHGMGPLPRFSHAPQLQLACAAIFVVEIVGLFSLLGTHGAFYRSKSQLWQLLDLWPITDTQRQLATSLPMVVAASVASCLSLPLLSKTFGAMGLAPQLLGLCFVFGLLGAFGAIKLFQGWPAWPRLVGVFGVAWLQYQVLLEVQSTRLTLMMRQSAAIMFFFLLCVLATTLLMHRRNTPTVQRNTQTTFVTTRYVPYFVKKVIRTTSLRTNWLIFGLTSTILAYVAHRQSVGYQLPLLGSLLVMSAFMSDVRSLATRYNPVEITGLRGSLRFMISQLTSYVPTISCASPLLLIALLGCSWAQSITACTQVLAACGIGLFTGSLLVPSTSDITSQCLAALICVGLLSLPLLTSISSWHQTAQASFYACTSLALMLASLVIEYQRNPYVWRKYATKKQP